LKFEFERYLAVYRGNRGSYPYRPLAVKIRRSVKKTLIGGRNVVFVGHQDGIRELSLANHQSVPSPFSLSLSHLSLSKEPNPTKRAPPDLQHNNNHRMEAELSNIFFFCFQTMPQPGFLF
jgi:hypothetical protein